MTGRSLQAFSRDSLPGQGHERQPPRRAATRPPSSAEFLLQLQRSAGNRAVSRQLQRCGPVPCDCSPEERAAKEGTVQRVAPDFRVTGKFPRSVDDKGAIYFDYESSAVTDPDDKKFAAFAGKAMSTVRLKGTASEEEKRGPGRAGLIDARIAAVEGPLLAGSPGTGTPTRMPDLTGGVGVIDYRSVRRVEILVPTASSSTPVCTPTADIACGPSPNAFDTGFLMAVALLIQARAALMSPTAVPAMGPLNLLFHGPTNAAAVDAGLAKIQAHLANMSPAIPLHDTTAAGHRCINTCHGADFFAENFGDGASARMTLGPRFLNEPSVVTRGLALIHEGSHGATGLTTDDKAYSWQRLIPQLSLSDALANADSYTRLIELIHDPSAASAAPADNVSALPVGRQAAATAAIAWLEQWLVQGRLELRALYGEMHPGGTWNPDGEWYRDNTLPHVKSEFGLSAPGGNPTDADKDKVAGVFDRLYALRRAITGHPFTVLPSGGSPSKWQAGPGPEIRLSNAFFGLALRDQINRMLAIAVQAAPFIESGRKDAYIRLVRQMATRFGP